MAKPHRPPLSRRERQIMDVLYRVGRATVAEARAQLPAPPSYSAVRTMLRILEAKGYVTHEKSGRAFMYRPLVDQAQARRRALSHLVSGLFNNSPSLLVLNVLEDEWIDATELDRLKQLILESE